MAKNGHLCPICGEGHLTLQFEKTSVECKDVIALLDSHYATFDACGSEQADAAQTRDNKRLTVVFKTRGDGLLTGAEVRDKPGPSQADAARMFGGGPVAFSMYESDDVAQSDRVTRTVTRDSCGKSNNASDAHGRRNR